MFDPSIIVGDTVLAAQGRELFDPDSVRIVAPHLEYGHEKHHDCVVVDRPLELVRGVHLDEPDTGVPDTVVVPVAM